MTHKKISVELTPQNFSNLHKEVLNLKAMVANMSNAMEAYGISLSPPAPTAEQLQDDADDRAYDSWKDANL